ncbi:MAG: amino acid--tRNA ligase-related protein [Candidatus Hodarchaeota archaeon]
MITQEQRYSRSGLEDPKQLENRHLQVGRSLKMNALTRIKATLLKSAREFFDNDGWLEVAPISAISTLAGACEDFSTLFSLDYFGERAFLIQTGQQHLEPYIQGPIKKVYAFNQSYRAETKAPERRLTAFLLIEAEAARYSLADIQEVQERLLYKLCTDVALRREADLKELEADIEKLVNLRIPIRRITYTEAIEMLNQMNQEDLQINWGEDLKGKHERALGKSIGQPFFVSHYPGAIKFFNMKDDPTDPRVVLSSDLLVPGYGEIIGASEREDDYEKLVAKLERFGRNEERIKDMHKLGIKDVKELKAIYEWYLDLRRFNGVPHAGFGLGFERLVQWICDLESIVEATEWVRNKEHLGP